MIQPTWDQLAESTHHQSLNEQGELRPDLDRALKSIFPPGHFDPKRETDEERKERWARGGRYPDEVGDPDIPVNYYPGPLGESYQPRPYPRTLNEQLAPPVFNPMPQYKGQYTVPGGLNPPQGIRKPNYATRQAPQKGNRIPRLGTDQRWQNQPIYGNAFNIIFEGSPLGGLEFWEQVAGNPENFNWGNWGFTANADGSWTIAVSWWGSMTITYNAGMGLWIPELITE